MTATTTFGVVLIACVLGLVAVAATHPRQEGLAWVTATALVIVFCVSLGRLG